MKSAQQNIRIPLFPAGAEITVYTAEGFDFDLGTGPLADLYARDGSGLDNPYPVAVAGEYFHRCDTGSYHLKITAAGWNNDQPAWLYHLLHVDSSTPEFADLRITSLGADSFWGNVAKSVLSWITTFAAWLKTRLADEGHSSGHLDQSGTISLPTATSFQQHAGATFYRRGQRTVTTEDEVVEVANAAGISFVYRDALTGALMSSAQAWTRETFLAGMCPVAITHGYDGHLIAFEERHNVGRDIRKHMNDHFGRGAYIDPTGFVRVAPSAASPATLLIGAGKQFDEDMEIPHPEEAYCRRWWRAIGGASMARDQVVSFDPRLMNGSKIRWDNAGTLTDGSIGKYYPYFVYAASEKWAQWGFDTGIYVVVAQGEYASAGAAKAAPRPTLPGFPTQELVLLYVVPYKQATANSVTLADEDIVDVRANQLGGSTSTGAFSAIASAISLAPIAGLAAENVQAGMAGLQGNKTDLYFGKIVGQHVISVELNDGGTNTYTFTAGSNIFDMDVTDKTVADDLILNFISPDNWSSWEQRYFVARFQITTGDSVPTLRWQNAFDFPSFPPLKPDTQNIIEVTMYAPVGVAVPGIKYRDVTNDKLDTFHGVATNLQGARQPTITTAVNSIAWPLGHVIIDYAGNTNLIDGFTDIPKDNAAALQVILLHNGGLRTFAVPAAQHDGTFTLGGTSGGGCVFNVLPTGSGKYTIVVVKSW